VQRRHFLGAGAAGALTLAGCGGGGGDDSTTTTSGGAPSGLPGSPDDGGILAFMLGLEQLQADLYRRTVPLLRGTEAELIRTIADQEDEHVVRLTAALKGRKRALPRPLRLRTVPADRNAALAAAYRLENLTASAYLGQIDRIVDPSVLATVLAIHTVEGRHAAAVGGLQGKTATPDGAMAQSHDMATIGKVLSEIAA
jgi:hypothetical protein